MASLYGPGALVHWGHIVWNDPGTPRVYIHVKTIIQPELASVRAVRFAGLLTLGIALALAMTFMTTVAPVKADTPPTPPVPAAATPVRVPLVPGKTVVSIVAEPDLTQTQISGTLAITPTGALPLTTTMPMTSTILTTTKLTPPLAAVAKLISSGAVIVFQSTSGVTNRTATWTVYPDGRIVASNGRSRRTTASAVAALIARIQAQNFATMADALSTRSCHGCSIYRLTLSVNGVLKSVAGESVSRANLPEPFRLAVDDVTRFVSNPPTT